MKKLFLPLFSLLLLTGCTFSYPSKAPSSPNSTDSSKTQPSAPSTTEPAVSSTCPGDATFAAAQLDAATKEASAQGFEPLPFVKVSEGGTLVDENGMSLYTFKKDELCKSNCTGECLVNWPPLTPNGRYLIGDKAMTGILGYISIPYVPSHITYNGVPLYFWKGDVNPGDTLGDGVNDVWFLAKP